MTAEYPRGDEPLIPTPALPLPALRQAVATVAPSRSSTERQVNTPRCSRLHQCGHADTYCKRRLRTAGKYSNRGAQPLVSTTADTAGELTRWTDRHTRQ